MIGNEVADGPVDVATKEGGGTIPIVVSAENGATGTTYVRYRSELVESTTYVKPSNTAEFAQFGISLSLAGDTLVVGAHEETGYDSAGKDWPMGAAHVFVKGDDGWHEQAALSPTQPGTRSRSRATRSSSVRPATAATRAA
jgi:hypothetical protein